MRCYCCNKILTPQEATSKFASGDYTEMCNPCLSTIVDEVEIIEGSAEESDDEEDMGYDD